MGKNTNSDSDDDDTFYYRFSSVPVSEPSSSTTNPTKPNRRSNGSGGLAPSKSTLYVSNLDYSLTNSDLHTLFSTFGKIARVTVLKDRHTRQSRGVAFIQFVSRDDAQNAVLQMNRKILNGRTISASIATDNGRAPEFIKKRVYSDKSKCYECGVDGHLSYECPRNQLGPRERPVPKRGRRGGHRGEEAELDEGDGGEGLFEDDSWASVVDNGAKDRLLKGGEGLGMERTRMVKKTRTYYSSDED